jgi:hypothetical protein
MWMAAGAVTLGPGLVQAADVCGARVDVRQIGMTSNDDGTRTVRYRASVQTDQVTCAKVTFSIIRSYIKPDGTAFEDAIPVDIQVPGRAVDVEGETLANTRRLIYWRAERISCQPCADGGKGNVPAAPVPGAPSSRRPAASGGSTAPTTIASSDSDGGVKVGKKAMLIGGAAAALGGAALVVSGSGGAAAEGEETPSPSPSPAATNAPSATATPAPGPTPTAAPSGPRVLPGAPPALPDSAETGDLNLLSTDPPDGNSVAASRGTVGIQLQVYIEKVTSNMRLEVQIFSGGETCLRDTSAPLDIKAKQPSILAMPLPNVRRCTAPFRTTLLRALLLDANGTKLARDYPIQLDFMP